MKTEELQDLKNLVLEQKKCMEILELQLSQKDQKIAEIEALLNWFKKQIFGKKSERIVDQQGVTEQLILEGCEGLQREQGGEAPPVPLTAPKKPRAPANRDGKDALKFSPDIPVETVILDIPESQKICPVTGKPLVVIGEERTQKLAHKAGEYFIKEIVRLKYAVQGVPDKGIITAELPDSLLPKCRADESLLAEIIVRKFGFHLPLYRIQESMGNDGVIISRKLLSQWVQNVGEALIPLYEVMSSLILSSGNAFIDETPVDIQAKGKCKTGYMWILVGGKGQNPPYRIYDFHDNRRHENAFSLLEGYSGVVHSDKYGAYETIAKREGIIWCPCWAHIRRKFIDAETGDPVFRDWVIRQIRYLFMFERVAWARSPEERLKIRIEKEIPLIDELVLMMKKKLIDRAILPKSKLSGAIGYFMGLLPYLKNYTKDPFAHLDNNVAERAVKCLTLGRKNWLFFGTVESGKSAAVLLSLIQTCRGLGINPREYLEDVLKRLMGHNAQKLHELLPDQWQAAQNKIAT